MEVVAKFNYDTGGIHIFQKFVGIKQHFSGFKTIPLEFQMRKQSQLI